MERIRWLVFWVIFLLTVNVFGAEWKDLDKHVKAADRPLSAEEVTRMVKLTMKALRGRNGWIVWMPVGVGEEIRHKAVIPVLVMVASNPKEHLYVRRGTIRALAFIADKEVIEQLLKTAEEGIKREEGEVYSAAFYVLHRLLEFSRRAVKEGVPEGVRRLGKEAGKGWQAEKALAYYKAFFWGWIKDKPIEMRKVVYLMKKGSGQ
jgi:hypothetical protein